MIATRLGSLDLETHRIRPGLLAPPIVCGSIAERAELAVAGNGEEMFVGGDVAGRLLYPAGVVEIARLWLADSKRTWVGANAAFDLGCLCARDATFLPIVFRAYREGRVHDILIAHALDAIAKGTLGREKNGLPLLNAKGVQTDRYSLDIVVRHTFGRTDAKENDFWKLRYAMLAHLPHEAWPEDARQYPVDDAVNTLLVAEAQLGLVPRTHGAAPERSENLADLAAQCESDFALHLGAAWGLRVDGGRLDLLEARAREMHDEHVARHAEHGFYRRSRKKYVDLGRRDPEAGKRDNCAVARAVAAAYGATGVCGACGGLGRAKKVKQVPCRGEKVKGRFQGCLNDPARADRVLAVNALALAGQGQTEVVCWTCVGTRMVPEVGAETTCGACSGTGYGDLSSVPKTAKGAVATDRDCLAESGDDDLDDFGDNKHDKILRTYAPWLRGGVDRALTLAPNVLLESGRASYRGPIQLFPTTAMGMTVDGRWVPTARECVVARPGRVHTSNDYSAGELVSLAQICLWLFDHSRMADVINETREPGMLHTAFAAKLTGESVEAVAARVKAGDKGAKNTRQVAKRCDFGLGGAMGAPRFVLTSRKENAGHTDGRNGRRYAGIRFCIMIADAPECGAVKIRTWGRGRREHEIPPTCLACLEIVAGHLIPLWFEQWPEVREYHNWVKRMLENSPVMPCFGPWVPAHGRPHRVRDVSGAVSPLSAGANGGFQSMIADVAKEALAACTREAYTDEDSVLYRARTRFPCFQHDELLGECDEELAHEVGPRISEVMMTAFRRWHPDVYGECGPALMRAWDKSAEAAYDATGKLVPWEPKKGK